MLPSSFVLRRSTLTRGAAPHRLNAHKLCLWLLSSIASCAVIAVSGIRHQSNTDDARRPHIQYLSTQSRRKIHHSPYIHTHACPPHASPSASTLHVPCPLHLDLVLPPRATCCHAARTAAAECAHRASTHLCHAAIGTHHSAPVYTGVLNCRVPTCARRRPSVQAIGHTHVDSKHPLSR